VAVNRAVMEAKHRRTKKRSGKEMGAKKRCLKRRRGLRKKKQGNGRQSVRFALTSVIFKKGKKTERSGKKRLQKTRGTQSDRLEPWKNWTRGAYFTWGHQERADSNQRNEGKKSPEP